MADNIRRKRPKVKLHTSTTSFEVIEKEEIEVVEEVIEERAQVEENSIVEEAVQTEEIIEEPIEEIFDNTSEDVAEEKVEEVPLEVSEEEMQVVLDEEGSLDGSAEEVEELASEEVVEEAPIEEAVVEISIEEPVAEETPEEVAPVEAVEEAPVEEPAPIVEEVAPVEEPTPIVEEANAEDTEAEAEEGAEKAEEKSKKDEFKLTAPANLEDVLANICTKRARKLIYKPSDVIFAHTTTVLGTDKANEEKIKVKNILDAEIKQGVKLGYLDKFDGLSMSEIKEEYENDIVYEYADQEFKRTGILLDGDKVKVYVYDWDMKACHHVGYIDDESAELVKPYIIDREKYSFDINGIIVGGKYRKVIKDEKTGKITVEKGNDGIVGLEIDINIINRKD